MTATLAFQPSPEAPRWKRWLLQSGFARIAIFAVLVFALGSLAGFLLKTTVPDLRTRSLDVRSLVRFGVQVFATVGAYLILVRFVERRKPVEFTRGVLARFAIGFLGGALMITIVIGLMAALGGYSAGSFDPGLRWWPAFLTGGMGAAISEEIVFRGVIFRIVEESAGTWMALAFSALLFGAGHLVNPGATLWSAFAIMVEAGVLFALLYSVTRSLWPCIGLHAGWNFTQGSVWGVPVSGVKDPSFLLATRSGPDWLTGGGWGAEGSVLAVIVCVAVSAGLLEQAVRRRSIVPFRHRRPGLEAPKMEGNPAGSD